MKTFLLIILFLSSINSQGSENNLIIDFFMTADQLVTVQKSGTSKTSEPILNYFQIDISSPKSWILKKKLNDSISSTYQDLLVDDTYTKEDLTISGDRAKDFFFVGEKNLTEKMMFIAVRKLEGTGPHALGSFGFSSRFDNKEFSLPHLMNENMARKDVSFILEITRDPTADVTSGHIVVGDTISGSLFNPEHNVNLDNSGTFLYRWTTEVKQIFFGNVLREKNDKGDYVIDARKYPCFSKNYLATFETVYNMILVPYDIYIDFFHALDKEYFLINGNHKCVSFTEENGIIRYKCPIEDVKKLGQLHFVLSNDLDIYLDEFDLFTCSDKTDCLSVIAANPLIKDHWVFGIPILRKFTTVFYPALLDGIPKMKFIGNRNKVNVTIIGKANDPDPYLSISFAKGIEDIQIPVLMGSNMEQAYFALDINGNISFVSNQVYNNYNESSDFEFVSNSSSHFVYGEFNLTGNLIKDRFTVANISTKNAGILLASKMEGSHRYETFRAAISASKKEHSFITALLDEYKTEKGKRGFMLEYDNTPDDEHMGYFRIGDFSQFLVDNERYTNELTLTGDEDEWEVIIDSIFFKDYRESKDAFSVYSINRKNPHFKAANNGIGAVFETVYADIIVPYNIKDEIKNYLLKHYFTIDDHQICDADFKTDNWDITCSFDEYKALGQIHILLQGNQLMGNNFVDVFFDNNDLFDCGTISCRMKLNIDPYVKDRFVFGNAFLKQFKTVFNLDEKKLYLVGDYNKVLAKLEGEWIEPIAPPSPKYSESEFEIDKNGLLLLSKKIKLGTPYQNISAIIDISGNITWVHDTLFVQEKSSTIQYKGKAQFDHEYFSTSGNLSSDQAGFSNLDIPDLEFQIADLIIGEPKYDAAIAFGRKPYINPSFPEADYSFIKKVYSALGMNVVKTQFMLQFNHGIEKENTGKLFIGEFDYDKTEYDRLEIDSEDITKWKSNLQKIYAKNILTNKGKSGKYVVYDSVPHLDLDVITVYFESRINSIIIPDNYAVAIFNFLSSNYFVVDGKKVCQPKKEGDNPIGYYCSKDEMKGLDQIHFVFTNNFDIYLEKEDLFKCTDNKCDFLIESQPQYKDAFYFGIPILKQFTTVFEKDGQQSNMYFKGKYNKANLEFVSLPPVDPEISEKLEVTNLEIINGLVMGKAEVGNIRLSLPFDINAEKSWIRKDKFNCNISTSTQCTKKKDSEEFKQDDFTVKGELVQDTFKVQDVAADIELILASEYPNNLNGAFSLSKGGNIISKLLEKLKVSQGEGTVKENSYFLRFGGEGPNAENVGTLYYGDIDRFITENEFTTTEIESLKGNKWGTQVNHILFKNYLDNNNNGVYQIPKSSYRIYDISINATFDSIYDYIFIPYKYKEDFFGNITSKYFSIEGKVSPCKTEKKNEIDIFTCPKDTISNFGQIHFITNNSIDIYLDYSDLFNCDDNNCEFLIQANPKFEDNLILGLPMLKKFDFVLNYKDNTILLLSRSNKAKVTFYDDGRDRPTPPTPTPESNDGWSALQIILLIFVIILGIFILGIAVIYILKQKNVSRSSITVDQGPMQKLSMPEQK